MRPLLSILWLALTFAGLQAAQAYTELKSYRDLKITKTHSKTWVIFDIDNTLIHPTGSVGSVEWAEYMRDRYIQAGATPELASQKQHELFGLTQSSIQVRIVDPAIFPFLRNMPTEWNVFALTARNPNLSLVTTHQLQSVSLIGALERSFPKLKQRPADLSLERGVIFANGQDKGMILETLLKNVETEPEEILFFDDKVSNVEAFDQAMKRVNGDRQTPIQFQSYHMTAVQPILNQFDAKAADRSWYLYRYLNSTNSYQGGHLTDPAALAQDLFFQESPVVSPDIESVKCEAPADSKAETVTVTCSYQQCLDWEFPEDWPARCLEYEPVKTVSYELQFLKDLGIYIRPSWEFFK